jgi:hypothetical protein
MILVVEPSGVVRCLYTEKFDLAALGTPIIRRGSHVEPDSEGQWWADLAPVDGPRLGPFSRRSEALAAEHTWLESHWLLPILSASPPVTCTDAPPATAVREGT